MSARKLIVLLLGIEGLTLALVALDSFGFNIPVLRQVAGFIFLTIAPGFLLTRILRMRNLGIIETLLYSVGLSVAIIMFLGLLVNWIYPLLGFSRPISLLPILGAIGVVVAVMAFLAYRQTDPMDLPAFKRGMLDVRLFSPLVLLLLWLPLLSALGALAVYLTHNNIILITMFVLIALIATILAFKKNVGPGVYPLAVWAIGTSLLLHLSLVSTGLGPFDVNLENNLQKTVLANGVWDYSVGGTVTAMLSVVMLGPIYSLILHMDTVWIIKIVYPLLFSIVPVAMFQAYRNLIGEKFAFFAAFVFMSFTTFWTDGGANPRQAIAEIFLALTLLLFASAHIPNLQRRVLLILFAVSLAVSHYGTSYIYMLCILLTFPLLFLPYVTRNRNTTVTFDYIALYFVFAISWYMYVSAGTTFLAIIRLGDHVTRSLSADFFTLSTRDEHIAQALGLAPMRGRELAWELARIVQYLTQFFIVAGVMELIIKWRKSTANTEYLIFSLVNLMVLGLSIALPYFAAAINMTRIYHLTLIFLAPLGVRGGIVVFGAAFKLLRWHRLRDEANCLKFAVVLVFVPYLLFGTGLIFELTGATPTSMPLNLYKSDWPVLSVQDLRASKWLLAASPPKSILLADPYGVGPLYQEVGGRAKTVPFSAEFLKGSDRKYVFLRSWNTQKGQLIAYTVVRAQVIKIFADLTSETDFAIALRNYNGIYDNGTAQVLSSN